MEIIIGGKYNLKIDKDRIVEAEDRLTKYYHKKKVDKLPFYFASGKAKCPSYTYEELVKNPDKIIEVFIARVNAQTESFPDTDFIPFLNLAHLGEGLVASMFGAKQLIIPGNPPCTEGRVMKNIYDLDKLKQTIDPNVDGWGPILKETCLKLMDATNGEIPIGVSDHQSPYGTATKICDNEELMMAMYDEPEMVHEFFSIVTQGIETCIDTMESWVGSNRLVKNYNAPVTGGKTGLILWDDYISVINPTLHTDFCKPYNTRLYEKYGYGHLHTCGPYFNGYIDACFECNPISMDFAIMRNMSRTKEDLIEFRKLTKEKGIILCGSPSINNTHIFSDNWEHYDDEYLHFMADGGILYGENDSFGDGHERTNHWYNITSDLVNNW